MLESFFCRPSICNFIKKRLQHKCFPVNISKLLITPILKEHLQTAVCADCGLFRIWLAKTRLQLNHYFVLHHPNPEIIFPLISFVAFMFLLLIFQTTFSEMLFCDENNITRQLRCKIVITKSCHKQVKFKR